MIIELRLSDAEIARIADAVAQRLAKPPTPELDPLRTVREAALQLRCSERSVRALIKIRRLRATRIAATGRAGGSVRVRIKQSEIDRLINKSTP